VQYQGLACPKRKEVRLLAIYHLSIKIITRGKGKSAVAAAAYRSGATMKNEYDGVIHHYSRKGGIVHTEILLPENATSEYADRSALWNAVEKAERYKTAQLAREIEIALPAELTQEQNISLVRGYIKESFTDAGMCADVCIHDKNDGNPHAHIMLTMRPIDKDGKWGQKSRTVNGQKIPTVDWNDRAKAEDWRKGWAADCNAAFRENGHNAVVDHRSYERQGIEHIPTVHLGPAAFQMEKRGIATERGNINRRIEVTNQRLRQLKARIAKLQAWLKEEAVHAEPPSFADVIANILSQRKQAGKSDRYQSIANLKAASKMFNFLQENEIRDMAELEKKVKSMHVNLLDIRDQLKPMERRLKTLDEHIQQADMYMEHKAVYRQYQEQKPKKQAAFAEKHREAITLFESADRYLKGVMNGRTSLPIKAWKAERAKLTTTKNRLSQDYALLKDEIGEVEQIRRSVYAVMREQPQRAEPSRA